MKKSLIIALALAASISVRAQQLSVETNDTALQRNSMFISALGITHMKFDDKGIATFSNDSITSDYMIGLSFGDYSYFNVILDPHKKLVVKLIKKNGKTEAIFKGPNAVACYYKDAFDKYTSGKNRGMEIQNHETDTLTYEQAFAKLDTDAANLRKLACKYGSKDEQAKRLEDIRLKELSLRLDMLMQKDYFEGKDFTKDETVKKLADTIDPNDLKYRDNDLIDIYIMTKMPFPVDAKTDVTQYGIGRLQTIDKYIKNPSIRHDMMENMVSQMLNADGADFENFLNVAKALCDTSIMNQYKDAFTARINTKQGTKCPDTSFSDPEGKSHHLSEFFGKVLFIDLWATWCGPCCGEIPYLEKVVEHYKGNNKVQFISISLDRDNKAWLKKLKEDNPQWPQFSTSADEDKVISKDWGVTAIPRFLIINADGTIYTNDAFRPSDEKFIEKMDAIIAVQK